MGSFGLPAFFLVFVAIFGANTFGSNSFERPQRLSAVPASTAPVRRNPRAAGAAKSHLLKSVADAFLSHNADQMVPTKNLDTSASSTGHFRVEPLEFDARVGSGELPVDLDGTPPTFFEPVDDEVFEPFSVANPFA